MILSVNIYKNRLVRKNAAENLGKQETKLLKNYLDKFQEIMKETKAEFCSKIIQKILFRLETEKHI